MSETEVTDSKITFNGVYTSEYAPKDEELKKANLLLIDCSKKPCLTENYHRMF